jgi:anti-sigma regulatory factor (Ser/Thr protein kinase)
VNPPNVNLPNVNPLNVHPTNVHPTNANPLNSSHQSQHWVTINHASDIAGARRGGQRIAQEQGFSDTRCGQLAIIVTEAATNILKHAGEGRMLLSAIHERAHDGQDQRRGIDILVFDRGPGIANLANALRDGVSSAGTAGNGLGAISRLADNFDVYAPRDKGTVLAIRVWAQQGAADRIHTGAACLPLAGEEESGDGWAVASDRRGVTLLLVDGLGHGPEAAKVAQAAIDTLALAPGLRPEQQIAAAHEAMARTRGAALALAQYDSAEGQLYFAGIGNISACIIDGDTRRQLMSHNGIVGHNMRKVQQFVYPCAPGALVVLHSDGIATQWDLDSHPGLASRQPALVAGVLLRDYARARDDACVLVHRIAEPD